MIVCRMSRLLMVPVARVQTVPVVIRSHDSDHQLQQTKAEKRTMPTYVCGRVWQG